MNNKKTTTNKKPLQDTFSRHSASTPCYCNYSNRGRSYHCHTDFYEFCLITSGSYQNIHQNTEHICDVGELLFFRSGESHTLTANDTESYHYAILVEESFFREYCIKHTEHAEYIFSTPYVSQKLSGPQQAYLTQLATIVRHATSADRTSVIQQFLSVALFSCFETTPDFTSETISIYSIDLQRRLDKYQILSENVADLCRDYPVSPAFLINDFKRLTGYTIVQYRNIKRLEYTAHLLQTENYPVSAIANELNIASLGYFSQQFKKKYGHSPKQYQLLHRSKK